jgi:hypothetical protein
MLPLPTAYLIVKGQLAYESAAIIVVAGFVLFLSIAGMCGARKTARGGSCIIVSYFYTVFFVVLALIYIALTNIVFTDNLEVGGRCVHPCCRVMCRVWCVVRGV